MVKCVGLLTVGLVVGGGMAAGQKAAPQINVTVVVVDAHVDPSKPVGAVGVSLSYVDSGTRVTDARDVTNPKGEAFLQVSPDAPQRGDLRVEVSGATNLVIYQPADGQLQGLGQKVTVRLLPKGSAGLLGPAQIEAMLHRSLLQVNSLKLQNHAMKIELAAVQGAAPGSAAGAPGANPVKGQGQGGSSVVSVALPQSQKADLSAAMAEWASSNGFALANVEQRVKEWAEDIQRRNEQASDEQRALAEVALKHYAAAAQLFTKAADADDAAFDAEDQKVIGERREKLRQLIKDREQAADAFQLSLQYHQATATLESARNRAATEYKRFSDDPGFHAIWLGAMLATANARCLEAENVPTTDYTRLTGQSVADYKMLADEYTETGDRQSWARTANDLGLVLANEAGRGSADKAMPLLSQAVLALQQALKVDTKEEHLREWARDESNLGMVLSYQGEQQGGYDGVQLIVQGIQIDQDVLKSITKNQFPELWALSEEHLGASLLAQAQQQGFNQTPLSTQAVQAFQAAQEVFTKEVRPQAWAENQSRIGSAFVLESMQVFDCHKRISILRQAIEAFQSASGGDTEASLPLVWADNQARLGLALADEAGCMVNQKQRSDILAQAVEVLRHALKVNTKADLPQAWAWTQKYLGTALFSEAASSSGAKAQDLYAQSADAYRNALQIFTNAGNPSLWTETTFDLGLALVSEAEQSTGEKTVGLYREVLDIYSEAGLTKEWASTQFALGDDLLEAAKQAKDDQALRLAGQAAQAYQKALQSFDEHYEKDHWLIHYVDKELGMMTSLDPVAVEIALGRAELAQAKYASADTAGPIFDQAKQPYQKARAAYAQSEDPDLEVRWLHALMALGDTLLYQAERVVPSKAGPWFEQAKAAYQESLVARPDAHWEALWAQAHGKLGNLYMAQGNYVVAAAEYDAALDGGASDDPIFLAAGHIQQDLLYRYDKALDIYTRLRDSHIISRVRPPSVTLHFIEANLNVGKFEVCVEPSGDSDAPQPTGALVPVLHTIELACQWGAGQKSATLDMEKVLAGESSTLERGAWSFQGTIHFLGESRAFGDGRAAWIALFNSAQNGDGPGMTKALHDLEPVLKQ